MLGIVKKALIKKLNTMAPEEVCKEGKAFRSINEDEKAFLYFENAANRGYAEAQYQLSDCYFYALGCTVDEEKSLYWCEKAAEQGHIPAQGECAGMYKQGLGCSVNPQKALYWYERCLEEILKNPGHEYSAKETTIRNHIARLKSELAGFYPKPIIEQTNHAQEETHRGITEDAIGSREDVTAVMDDVMQAEP